MVATTPDGAWGIPIGAPVYSTDGRRLGYVLDGDAYQLEVGDGFLFRRSYAVKVDDVEGYVDGALYLKITMEQVELRQR